MTQRTSAEGIDVCKYAYAPGRKVVVQAFGVEKGSCALEGGARAAHKEEGIMYHQVRARSTMSEEDEGGE